MIDETLLDTMDKMAKAVEHSRSQFSTVRTGRASPGARREAAVSYYGSEVPLQQLAGFSVPEARLLVVQPYDKGKDVMAAIEKAIRNSDLGINPSNDGVVIRLAFPPLTEERRRDYVKVVKHMAEEGRVAVRNIRRDARKHLEAAEKQGEISADELDRAEKELEKLTHEHIEDIDKALTHKEHELLEV